MGSFNRTCFLTNVPITAGDPVVGFFVLPGGQRASLSGIHATDRGGPISAPFRGTYNDYGWLEPSLDQSVRLDVLQQTLAIGCVVKDEAGDGRVPFQPSDRSLNDIYKLVHARRLVAKTHSIVHPDGEATVVAALCHAAAWDALVATPAHEWPGDEEGGLTIASLMATVDDLLDDTLTKAHARQMPTEESVPEGWRILVTLNVRGVGLKATGPSLFLSLARVATMAHDFQTNAVMDMLEGMAEVVLVTHHMDALHLSWMPAIGASQEEYWDLMLMMSDVTRDLLAKGRAEAMGDYDDDH